jgi:hypothetical protein
MEEESEKERKGGTQRNGVCMYVCVRVLSLSSCIRLQPYKIKNDTSHFIT